MLMATYIYANATSLFDYSNGASRSLKLLFERLAESGNKVYVVSGFISNCKTSFDYTQKTSKRIEEVKNIKCKMINHFTLKGVNYSLIKTRQWSRLFLASDEQECIYYESIRIIDEYNIDIILGWGNLLLEESIFKYAKRKNLKLCFYLVNPYYKNKKSYLLENADLYITDSEATRNLYSEVNPSKFFVLPKLIESPSLEEVSLSHNKLSNTCLFINPSIKKGLEPFLAIANYFEKERYNIKFLIIDSKSILRQELSKLSINMNMLPANISFRPPSVRQENIFKNVSILLLLSLWHESGSRLIYESYSRGIPVLAFDTGGTKEFIGDHKDDIFEPPLTTYDSMKTMKIKQWDILLITGRIKSLLKDIKSYEDYSLKIKSDYEKLNLNDLADRKLKELTNNLLSP